MDEARQEKTIDGRIVVVNKLPGWANFLLLAKLTTGVFPAAASVMGSIKDLKTLDIDGEGLSKAAVQIIQILEPSQLRALTNEILASTFVDGKEVLNEFDMLFQGNIKFLGKCVAFTLQVNYNDFLPAGWRSNLDKFLASKKQ